MPWSKQDYPSSFKNLTPTVRDKAIEIANALLRDHYSESRAISIALSKAREAVEDGGDRPEYIVKHREDDWILMRKNGKSAIYAEETKQTLLNKAKTYVNEHNGVLTIYREDGKVEQTLYEF